MFPDSRKNYSGLYIPRDGKGAGQLTVAGKNTSLKLVGKDPWEEPAGEFFDHHGLLNDGTKASLLECIAHGITRHWRGKEEHFEFNAFPHYILVGKTFINSDDAVVRALQYHFENVNCLVHNFGTFGTIRPTREEFEKILESDHRRRENIAKEHGWPKSVFEPKIGEDPALAYYNGVWEIAKCHAEVGMVTLTNRVSHGMGSSKGIGFDNEITVRIEFSNPKTIGEATRSLWTLHGFFELCLGRRQRFLKIEVDLTNGKPDEDGAADQPSELLWSYCNEHVEGETGPTIYGDILLDLGAQKDEFANVLSGWLDSASTMGDARNRFATAFHAGSYGIDRMVGAANMFDLLPPTHVPTKKEPDGKTKEAVDECCKRFKALPHSFARESVLSALGRVGTAGLRDKICHRADIVLRADPERFPQLHLPCSQAVLCRNHYVHGSPATFDYHEEFSSLAFLTDTLEFVFGTSDLIELGWNYNFWINKGTSLSHNFGSYVFNYRENLRRLKKLVKI